MKIKADFIGFDKLIYKQKNGKFEEDELFKELSKELNLNNIFDYQMAFLKDDEVYHCFLTQISNLPNTHFCYPKPLIFQVLNENKMIKEDNFCILEINATFVYLCFYKKGKFKSFKKIKNEENWEYFLKQNRIIELLKYYESEMIIALNTWNNEIPNFSYKTIDYSNDTLAKLSISCLDNQSNFIKGNKNKFPLYFQLSLLFLIVFLFASGGFILNDFIKYQNHKKTYIENENSQNEIYTAQKEQNQKLQKSLEDLNLSLYNENILLEQNLNQLHEIKNTILPYKNNATNLEKIISWLNQFSLKISALKLNNSHIILTFINKENYQKALKVIKSDFILALKDKERYQITLELQ